MGNFATIFGFLFSFLLLMMIVPGMIFLYQKEVDSKTQSLKNYEKELMLEKQNLEILNFYNNLGKINVNFLNDGDKDLFLKDKNNKVCFDIYFDDRFVERRNFYTNDFIFSKNYNFIESQDKGNLYFFLENLSISNLNFKFISCDGITKNYYLDIKNLNWWSSNFGKRENFVFENNESKFVNQSYVLNLNSTNTDFDFLDEYKDDLKFIWNLEENNLILGLNFDVYEQILDDFSKYDNKVYLGGNSANATTDPLNIEGVFFSGLGFDGVRQYNKVVDSSILTVEDEISISAFLKWNLSDDGNSMQNIFTNGAWHNALRVVNDESVDDGKILFQLNIDGVVQYLYSNFTLDENWHLITASYDGNFMKIYVDDKLDSSLEIDGEIISNLDSNYIGSESISGYFFNGFLDELRVFNVGLDLEDVKNIYNNKPLLKELSFETLSYNSISKTASFNISLPFVDENQNSSFYLYYNVQ